MHARTRVIAAGGPRRWAVVAGAALASVLAVMVVVRVHHVYEEGGELRLTPSAAPPVIHQWGRDYGRSQGPPSDIVPPRTNPIGQTPGGGTVYEGDDRHQHVPKRYARAYLNAVPTVLWVRDSHRFVTYALSGGP